MDHGAFAASVERELLAVFRTIWCRGEEGSWASPQFSRSSKKKSAHFRSLEVNLVVIAMLSRGNCGLSTCTTRYLVASAAADQLTIIFDVTLWQSTVTWMKEQLLPMRVGQPLPVCTRKLRIGHIFTLAQAKAETMEERNRWENVFVPWSSGNEVGDNSADMNDFNKALKIAKKVTELRGNRIESFRLFLSLVMGKDSQTRRVMWESIVKMRTELQKLDKILKDIQELGPDPQEYINISQGLSQIPTQLTGPSSEITELLASCDDSQLLRLTDIYRDRLEQKITEFADKGKRAESSTLPLNIGIEKPNAAQGVKMAARFQKIDEIIKETQQQDIQLKHMETLRAQTETLRVNTILMSEKVKVFKLVDRYTELIIISTVRDRRLVEHELLARGRDHEEWRQKHLRRELEKIQTDQLFGSCFSLIKSKHGSSAVVAGVAGIGKTTMIQKIVHDWAMGKIYQQFQFVFCFKFRDLNTINHAINLQNLILFVYPYLSPILNELWKKPEGLLFIFDGLDEFNDQINFSDSQRDTEPRSTCTDPEFRCKVSDIVYSLIQRKLLPGCSVLVTTRPTELHLLEKAEINVRAEILGFDDTGRKDYFKRSLENQTVAANIFNHVKENENLYTMSFNPSYCWILALSLGPFFTKSDRDHQLVPKSITQLYSYCIYNILKNHSCEIEKTRDVLLKVGQMAFTGVSKKKMIFTEEDLAKHNLQPSQFLSGFLTELLEREDSAQSVVYTFPHFIIQEFIAAVAQFLNPHPGDILKFLTEANAATDGRFEVILRFVAGLSSPMTARGLEEFLGPFPHQTTCRVIDWVKEEVKRQIGNTESEAGKRSLLNTLHYVYESRNSRLAQNTLGYVRRISISGLRLTPNDCAVLSYVINFCNEVQHLNLWSCLIRCEGLQTLKSGLHKCMFLGLGRNKIEDSGMLLISEALRKPRCKIQRLGLDNNGLTDSCIKELTSALGVNSSLTELDLGDNNLGDSGIILLSEVLRQPNCKLQKMELYSTGLTDSCAEVLSSALMKNISLVELDLGCNELGDSGVKHIFMALRNPSGKLQKLCLWGTRLTASCAKDLSSALSINSTLTELDLGYNRLKDSGIKLLCAALEKPDSKIQKLRIDNNELTVSCAEVLASVLRTNRSLTDLDLCYNRLEDSGMKHLCVALKDQNCKIQKLGLEGNSFSYDGLKMQNWLQRIRPGCNEEIRTSHRIYNPAKWRLFIPTPSRSLGSVTELPSLLPSRRKIRTNYDLCKLSVASGQDKYKLRNVVTPE
ncbi:NACHT, LRR and PYD domains-containing protein 3-like [Hypanus sabinus]|uniref:NACHT, LRR and PYD domains-containing protein 3-like n=1 Tax=Hypanus sabinus TaxID=79690 RepID=UPI0028C40EF2|nr:NACHT, LRR and PYD domains-containing protein 3-like [Hypanus sabinus]